MSARSPQSFQGKLKGEKMSFQKKGGKKKEKRNFEEKKKLTLTLVRSVGDFAKINCLRGSADLLAHRTIEPHLATHGDVPQSSLGIDIERGE
jgi:hypothetical protein